MAGSAFAQYRRGVNVSGAEFGNKVIPGVLGTNYTFNSENTFRYFNQKQLSLFRVPVLWERLQPVLRQPLDPAYLSGLKANIGWAKAYGGQVIIDIQNFGRYSMNEGGSLNTYIIDNPAPDGTIKVSASDLADLWVRLSSEFKFDGGVYAYDLMNEPHDMGSANWQSISQTVVGAIRANQDDKLLLVPGNAWSTANRWLSVNGSNSWIDDPSNNFMYEAHVYFDSDESGTYALSYDAELARNSDLANVGRTRLSHFISWVQANNVRGIIDEYGIPDNDSRWGTVLENFFAALDAAGMDGAYWAAGEWWGNYPLSVQPAANFTQDRPQMANLEAHLGHGYLTALSSASVSVARATSGSLVTVYGPNFTTETAQALTVPYPIALADITVEITDSSGATASAGLLFVSPGQINFQMPLLLAPGRANIVVKRAGTAVAAGSIQVALTAPAIFTANSAGYGLPAAWLIRIKADGSVSYEPIAQFDGTQFNPVPIDFGAPADRLFLSLYGTGIHGSSITAAIAGAAAPVDYAGPQGQYPGLDQINVELSRTLAGAGTVNVSVSADGVAANAVSLAFK